ncbi:MAG: TAXI family TRAP transporter solute-binding subunit [Acidobacteriota bacterium]
MLGLALSAGCGGPTAKPPVRPVLRVANAFAPFSVPLTAEYKRSLPRLDVQAQNSADSYGVIDALQHGNADLGIALADVAYAAYWSGETKPASERSLIRGVSLLQPLSAYVLVRARSGIHRLADLQGRNVGLGARTSSSSNLAYLLLDAFDVRANITNVATRAEGAAGLKNGTFDAIFLPGYTYPDEVTYSAIKEGAYLIPIEGEPLERLRWNNPFVRLATIPRDIYPGQNQMIPTVGIDMVVLCRRDLDESIVYDVTAQLFNAYPRLSGVEASLKFLNIDEAPATPIPLHAGAARYFRERELSR